MKRWFVAHTHPNGEAKAALNLRRQNFEVYAPHYLKLRRHARRRDLVRAPLFPRYLFVALDLERDRWRAVRSTLGVSDIVHNGDLPVPVASQIIDDIRRREDRSGNIQINRILPFSSGDRVRVLLGSFADQIGIFDCETDEERVGILLNILGRTVKVQLPFDAIGAYS